MHEIRPAAALRLGDLAHRLVVRARVEDRPRGASVAVPRRALDLRMRFDVLGDELELCLREDEGQHERGQPTETHSPFPAPSAIPRVHPAIEVDGLPKQRDAQDDDP